MKKVKLNTKPPNKNIKDRETNYFGREKGDRGKIQSFPEGFNMTVYLANRPTLAKANG